MVSNAYTPMEVYCSYAHEDEPYVVELKKHLSGLQHQGYISIWHDRQVAAGTDWAKAVDTHLENASIILLLISSDFLASDYTYGIEMQRALERHREGTTRTIPILVRPCDWSHAPFADIQILPTDGRAITRWEDRDEAWSEVARGIRRLVEDFSSRLISPPHAVFPSLWNIPYSRNPLFTGREEILAELNKAFYSDQTAVHSQLQVISGLGGIGKTQIAVEYAYRHQQDYQIVLWTQADTQESLVSGYVAIAELLNLPEKNAPDVQVLIEAIKTWLQTQDSWLLILDDVNDFTLVRSFLPSTFSGHLLLTTRAQAVGEGTSIVEVGEMNSDEGTLLLLYRAKLLKPGTSLELVTPQRQAEARAIVSNLGGLPLAIAQAGAYIDENRYELAQYLSLYETRHEDLLSYRDQSATDYPESIATTWLLSFEKVYQEDPAAIEILYFCALLAPDPIPEELLIGGSQKLGARLGSVAADKWSLNKALGVLGRYSLIKRRSDNDTLSMYRLVQRVLLDKMEEPVLKLWAERVVRAVDATFPQVEYTSWPQCERLLTHALACQKLIEQHGLVFPEVAHLLQRIGWYLGVRARYNEAEPLLEQALTISEQVEQQSLSIACNAITLGWLYHTQGKYEQAELLYQRARAIQEQHLGSEHLDITLSLNNLAALYVSEGKYEEAEPLYQRVLTIREQQLGSEHLDITLSLNNLAALYRRQGKYEEAELLYLRTLTIRERQLGPSHPDIALSLNNLAVLYASEGRYSEAEPLYQRALAICERQLGSEHPDVALNLNNLAALYVSEGRYEAAEQLYQRALRIRQELLGLDHPDTAQSFSNLAILYLEQRRESEAEPLLQEALAIRKKILGPMHPDLAESLYWSGFVFRRQKMYEEAKGLYQKALVIREQILGLQHPDTKRLSSEYASLLRITEQEEKA